MIQVESAKSPVAYLFGIPIEKVAIEDVVERADRAIRERRSLNIGVVNAAKVVNMQRNAELAEAVLGSDEIYADGMSVVWASRLLGDRLPERVAGIDLMYQLLQLGDKRAYRFYLLGATADVVQKTAETFSRDYPNAEICGYHDGYFDATDEESIAKHIKRSRADVLFVAITSPKKERFMARWARFMSVPVVHGVGGSFDVVAGKAKRAPEAWQRSGFEWLYRLMQEPRRLMGRYLSTNTRFLGLVLTAWTKQTLGRKRSH
jgi:N-acetylglucosaminyldiphosphoundecaprenol N-acetyl-beta-D-mannosaminyltransferase